jgi:Restriction endonuclease
MLTPTDIHILVGLFTLVTSPDSVEIMLGDFVYDAKAEERRDVDVTVTYKDKNGLISTFKGIEVKKHTRPLDVAHVEQLCVKLNDMPEISHKAIVSASGYTQPARKKANAYSVNLYSLIPWSNTVEGLEHVQFAPNFVIQQQVLSWASPPSITFHLETLDTNQAIEINKDTPLCNVAGDELDLKTIQHLSDRLSLSAVNQLVNNEEIKAASPEVEKEVRVLFDDLGNICADIDGSKIRLKQALVEGLVIWKEHNLSPEFKVLVSDGELKPYVGCAITEMLQGNLAGLTVSQVDRNINFINIPVSDRNRKKIQQLRLK